MNLAIDSEGLSIHLEPADMYCYAMMCCIKEARLKIANDKNTMANNDEYVGFIDYSKGLLRLRPDVTIFGVRRYWEIMEGLSMQLTKPCGRSCSSTIILSVNPTV